MNPYSYSSDTPQDQITDDIKQLINRDQARTLDAVLEAYPMLVDRRDINERGFLHHAAESGSWGCIEVLLKHGLDINMTDVSQETPLHRALTRHRLEATECLLKHGANPNIRNTHGATAALYAASWSSDALDLVIQAGGDETVLDKSSDGIAQWAIRGMRQAVEAAKVTRTVKI